MMGMMVDRLRCEFLQNPLGLATARPRLSWQLADARRGAGQRAYQIQVCGVGDFAQGANRLWDSGRVASAQNHLVTYDGLPLAAGKRVYWRVRVWDHEEVVSPWSETASWGMGRLGPQDWNPAIWIGLDRPDPGSPERADGEVDDFRRLPARYLRRAFALDRPVRRATVSFCGLGVCDLHVNGRRVAEDEVMNPSQTDFSSRVLYQVHDVTGLLKEGPNVLGVVLGNGRFQGLRPRGHRVFGYPKLLLHLDIEHEDGTRTTVVGDTAWRVTDRGPLGANHEYDGEAYDARLEMPGWDEPGFDDGDWEPVVCVDAPGGVLEPQAHEPTRIVETITPVEVRKHATGVWLVDFGYATYGQPLLRLRAEAGTRIRVVGAYSLRPDGTLKTEDNRGARCTDVYICKGGGLESWAPRFRGQGCRWLEISGWPGTLNAADVRLNVVRHGAERAGRFSCSDPLLTRISDNVRGGVRAFLRQGLPMEPDRDERQPWLGDPACDARSYAVELEVAPFLRKWMGDIRAAQKEDGSLPAIAPMYWIYACKTDAVWPAVITIVPLWLYGHYGDRRVLEENYPVACRWVDHLASGLRADGTTDNAVYGDWCDTASMDELGSDHGATPLPLIASAYLCHHAQQLARMAAVLGRPAEAERWRAKATRWTEAFNGRFFDAATALYRSGTQCALLLPLAFGLVPDEYGGRVLDHLVRNILDEHQGHTTVGLIGNQWLLPTLSRLGRADVAHTIATRTARPSWGYMVEKGATTVWERWDTDTRGSGMNSEALLIQAGTLGAWFVETLAGISPHPESPGFTRIRLKPQPLQGLSWVKAEQMSPQGMIESEWHVADGQWIWKVMVPPNSSAEVHVPCSNPEQVREGDGPATAAAGIRLLRVDADACVFDVVAGRYQFQFLERGT